MTKVKNLKSKIVWILLTGLAAFTLFFIVTCLIIGNGVKKQCQEAKDDYSGSLPDADCVEVLTVVLNDYVNQSYRERNSAIWALGQFGDDRALPVLQKFYTNNIPEKESLSESISQYELKKAIHLAGGGFNATAVFWRSTLVNK